MLPAGWKLKRVKQHGTGLEIDEWAGKGVFHDYQFAADLLQLLHYEPMMRKEVIILRACNQPSEYGNDIACLTSVLEQNMQDSSFSPIGAVAVCSSVHPRAHYFKSYGRSDSVKFQWLNVLEFMQQISAVDGDVCVMVMGDEIMYELEGK